jgi:cyclic lactone autoinducer peptide
MKITVIKKSNGKVKTMSACPWILDEPPVSKS